MDYLLIQYGFFSKHQAKYCSSCAEHSCKQNKAPALFIDHILSWSKSKHVHVTVYVIVSKASVMKKQDKSAGTW